MVFEWLVEWLVRRRRFGWDVWILYWLDRGGVGFDGEDGLDVERREGWGVGWIDGRGYFLS